MGVFTPLDFNGDGIINRAQDFNDAAIAINTYGPLLNPPLVVFATGDIDGDGEITMNDLADLQDLYDDYEATGNIPLKDYGAPNDL